MKIPPLAALLLLTATSAVAQNKSAWRAARPSGDPISCLQTTQIRDTRVRDDQTIDFYMRNGQVYRNVLPQTCPQLGFERRFTYRISNNQLCAVDVITVLRLPPVTTGVTCGLGKFQPVTGAGR